MLTFNRSKQNSFLMRTSCWKIFSGNYFRSWWYVATLDNSNKSHCASFYMIMWYGGVKLLSRFKTRNFVVVIIDDIGSSTNFVASDKSKYYGIFILISDKKRGLFRYHIIFTVLISGPMLVVMFWERVLIVFVIFHWTGISSSGWGADNAIWAAYWWWEYLPCSNTTSSWFVLLLYFFFLI